MRARNNGTGRGAARENAANDSRALHTFAMYARGGQVEPGFARKFLPVFEMPVDDAARVKALAARRRGGKHARSNLPSSSKAALAPAGAREEGACARSARAQCGARAHTTRATDSLRARR